MTLDTGLHVVGVRTVGVRTPRHNQIFSDGYTGYYTVARRYEFYFPVAKQYSTNQRCEWVKYCFCHEKIKFISSSCRVMFFLLYRQRDINKLIEGNYRNYVIDKTHVWDYEFYTIRVPHVVLWILQVVYFTVKHSCVYNRVPRVEPGAPSLRCLEP